MNLALVCGGRDFTTAPLVCGTIDACFRALVVRPSDKVVIRGEAPGADRR
jgi:hypothetical protein